MQHAGDNQAGVVLGRDQQYHVHRESDRHLHSGDDHQRECGGTQRWMFRILAEYKDSSDHDHQNEPFATCSTPVIIRPVLFSDEISNTMYTVNPSSTCTPVTITSASAAGRSDGCSGYWRSTKIPATM